MFSFSLQNIILSDDAQYLTPMFHLARAFSTVPNFITGRTIPAYTYHFETLPRRLLQDHERLGVLHTGEIPFVFNAASLWDYDGNSPEAYTSRRVGGYWAAFAKSGDSGMIAR